MAKFDIISKDGSTVRYSGKPRYNGAYLKPSYLEFSEIASPTPIAWEVGDYVDYSRTGMRYRLYSVPQASKNARKGSHGRAFTYTSVQFFAATKELEIALFRDLVGADNNIHFSSSPDVSTFENVEGIARRIQACMDDFYPGRWEIRIADFDVTADAEIIKKIGEAKEFALSGGTCLDALSKIYELWQDIGWVHTYEGDKEVIIIGYPNKRIDENTTEPFLYGKGNGLTAIKKNQTNNEEFATRLYVYGSERNLPPRYYNGKDILNAESVDIRNLMIPLDSWGKTDGLPDARKAYLENAEAVAKYGVIPKTHYFDSDDAGADIYPSITGMTIGMIRTALEAMGEQNSSYYPSEDAYPDSTQRVDVVRYCDNPTDDGSRGDVALQEITAIYAGKQRTISIPSGSASANIVSELLASHSFTISEAKPCKVVFNPAISGYVTDDGFEKVEVKLTFYDTDSSLALASATQKTLGILNDGQWQFNLPSISYDYTESPRAGFSAYIYLTITVTLASGNDTTAISYVLDAGTTTFSLFPILDKTFLLRLHEIGFNINAQASLGKGKAISMKTGMCAGRTFLIESCRHKSASGYWDFTVKRQQDNTLGLVFPNKDYQIVAGDEFVLLDIAMPELYILANSQKLLSEGEKLLARASKIQSIYEPSIDAKVMAESGRVLREGMFMEITDEDVVDNTTDYILIDTLSISEGESSIPTYKVTLKERRKVTYKGTPSATSATETESVEEDAVSNTEVDVDLSDYYTKEEVNNEIEGVSKEIDTLADLLTSMWRIEDNKIVTDMDVLVKANLIVEGDTSSGGEGQDTPASGISGIYVNGTTYTDTDGDGFIDLGTIGGGLDESALASYLSANKYISADNLTTYGVATQSWVSGNYLPLTGGTISGQLTVSNINGYTPITSGNIGSYNAGSATKLAGTYHGSADVSSNPYFWLNESGKTRYYLQAYNGNLCLGPNEQSFVLNSSGNVGIGTTSPSSKLSVHSNATSALPSLGALATAYTIEFGNAGKYGTYLGTLGSGNGYIQQGRSDGTATAYNLLLQPLGGNVGIGTSSPAYKLDVAGTGRFTGAVTMSSTLTVGGNITPSIHNAYNVGVYNNCFTNIHSNIITGGANNNNLWLVGGAYNSSIGIQFARNAVGTASGKIGSWDATGLYPATNNAYTLGTSSYQWSTVYGVNGIFSGDTSSGSDIRFKDIIKNKTLKIEDIAKAPLFTFKWNDRDDDTIHLGSSAQYWEKVCPWLVTGEDFKSLNYATLGVAMGISLAKKAVNHEERIKVLEKEIKRLKEEMR